MTDSLRYFGDVYPLDGLPGALGAAPGPNPEIGENYDHLRIPDVTSGISRRAWVDSNRGLTFEVDAVAQMQAYSVSLFVGDVDHSPWMGKQSGYFGGGYTWSSLSPQALLAFGSTMPGVSYAFGSLGHASGAPVQMNSGYSMSQLGLDELHCAVSYYMPVPGGRRAFVLGNTLTIRTNPSNPFSN